MQPFERRAAAACASRSGGTALGGALLAREQNANAQAIPVK